MKITATWLKSATTEKPQQDFYDDWTPREGMRFGIRINKSGTKAWFLMYKDESKKKQRMTLGRFPEIDPTTAKDLATEQASKILRGSDPMAIRRSVADGIPLIELIDEFDEWLKGRRAERTRIDYMERLKYFLLNDHGKFKSLKNMRSVDITNSHLRDRAKQFAKKSPVGANKAISYTRRLYNFGIEEDICPSLIHNPCDYPKKIRPLTEEKPRTRYLSDLEIYYYWQGLEAYYERPGAKILMIMLLTGQRGIEVKTMTEKYLSDWEGWWKIPKHIAKNRIEHYVPLTERIKKIIAGAKADRILNSDYLFPIQAGNRVTYINALGKTRAKIIEHAKTLAKRDGVRDILVEELRPHDLRHTVGTHLSRMRYPEEWIGKLFNHNPKSITGKVYIQHDFADEKKEMLEAWDKKISEIVGK